MSLLHKTGADAIHMRHSVLKAIREFFYRRDFIEVETPYLVKTSPPDPYIDPLNVYAGGKGPFYLHTSPEVGMKKLLAAGHRNIFQVCKVFRVEEFEEQHSTEFTMLEWYMKGTYTEAMKETEDLVRFVSSRIGAGQAVGGDRLWHDYRLSDLFLQIVGFNPLPCSRDELIREMRARNFQGIDLDESWEELFFKLLIQEIEPKMQKRQHDPYFIRDWPASLTAMAKKKDGHTVERFELYMRGLEIANGYTELIDAEEQKERLMRDRTERVRLKKTAFPIDSDFLKALSRLQGPIAGVALGVDRLLMVLTGSDRIEDILFDRFTV